MPEPRRLRIAYAGTPAFASTALQAICDAGWPVCLVLTQPDRPAGRGMKLQASPVKQLAQARGLPLAQPQSLRLDGRHAAEAAAAQAALQAAAPDLMVVAAYGLILPRWVLELPRLGCLNIHGSLLPRWRGAAPIQRAIEAGDSETGITIMQMDEGLDTGPMLLRQALPIMPEDSSSSLHDRLAACGAGLVLQALEDAAAGQLRPQPQPQQGACYAHKIEKAEAAIDWRAPAAEIERRLRAFDPFPGCTATLAGQTVKLWRGRVLPTVAAAEPGQWLPHPDGSLVTACGEGALQWLELQLPGGRRMSAAQWRLAHPQTQP